MSPRTQTSFLRPLAVIAILILGAYWAGARWGTRQPINVEAIPNPVDSAAVKNASFAERDAALSGDEALNVRIYRQSSSAVANILTKATEYDFDKGDRIRFLDGPGAGGRRGLRLRD